ncbi:MAG TPA: ferric reductase-like transmembrane domain-containing protein [Candidatus Saccharimonadales bacterium]|nr:ferric reductase-like transmembrane domain-containing protein [Candidatus Saccharimonadales bacterium]
MILTLMSVSTVHVVIQRASASWPWYVIRASGFTAAGLLILLMLSGIGQVTGLTYRFVEPIKAWAIHKTLAIAMCVSIAIHGSFLLIDQFVKFSLPAVVLPFVSHYSNGTKLLGLPLNTIAVSMGILASYGIVLIVLSSLKWMDTKKRAWRKLHYLSYVVAILVFLHALYSGSDLKYGAFRTFWILLGFIVLLGIISRLARRGSTSGANS